MPATALGAGSIGVNQKDKFYLEFIDSIINKIILKHHSATGIFVNKYVLGIVLDAVKKTKQK